MHARLSRRPGPLRWSIVAAVVLLALQPSMPAPTGPDTAAPEFSSARARAHVEIIAAEPHPIGSAANERVRGWLAEQLRALGLDVDLQTAGTRMFIEGRELVVHNIAARLRGRDPQGAILISAHHDSVRRAPGAGDNGAAVAALLETLRALRAGPALRQDVIALFSDGEEFALLGAQAFARDHAWRSDVRLVFNYDARGSRGPSLMFQTSAGAGALVRAFARAAPHPLSNSLMAAVYERMPNDTDFTVYRRAGWPGLNFAFIGGYETYHTELDVPARLDERTLAHHGESMLALLRRLGDSDLPVPAGDDAVWFNPVGSWLLVYPAAWVWPLTAVAVALLAAALALGRRAQWIRVRCVAAAALLCLLAAVAAGALAFGLGRLALAVFGIAEPGPIAHTGADAWGFVAIVGAAIAVAKAGFVAARRRVQPIEVALGAALCWTAGLVATSVWLPAATFLCLVPPLPCVAVVALGSWRLRAPRVSTWLAACVPALVLVAPLVVLFCEGMTLALAFVAMPLVVLTFGLLEPLAGGGDDIAGAEATSRGTSGMADIRS